MSLGHSILEHHKHGRSYYVSKGTGNLTKLSYQRNAVRSNLKISVHGSKKLQVQGVFVFRRKYSYNTHDTGDFLW